MEKSLKAEVLEALIVLDAAGSHKARELFVDFCADDLGRMEEMEKAKEEEVKP